MGTIYTIPLEQDFLQALARAYREKYAQSPLLAAQTIILFPTQRACRRFETLLAHEATMLLPICMTLGNIPLEWVFSEIPQEERELTQPLLSQERRLLLLGKLIHGMAPSFFGDIKDVSMQLSLRLAGTLVGLLDQVQTEGLTFENLKDVFPQEYAAHWQVVLQFLDVLAEYWPQILRAEGSVESSYVRRRILELLAQKWTHEPPIGEVWIVGSTGTIPATATLMKSILSLECGKIVLPGFTQGRSDVSSAHPFRTMYDLLEKLSYSPEEVVPWPLSGPVAAPARTQAMLNLFEEDAAPYNGAPVTLLECDTLHEEGEIIALLLRELLETPDKTAALVTSDRRLAAYTSAALLKWGIMADDSAGLPLRNSLWGSFSQLVLNLLTTDVSTPEIMAFLRHELTCLSDDIAAWYHVIDLFERDCLRVDFAEREGAATLTEFCEILTPQNQVEKVFIEHLLQLRQTIPKDFAETTTMLLSLMMTHPRVEVEIQEFLGGLIAAGQGIEVISWEVYRDFFHLLLREAMVRQPTGLHPRIWILGPIEARLIRPDRIILGSMNEGQWPPMATEDPWMSHGMRAQFGLPKPERRLGLSAHDFIHACGAEEVFCTRARLRDGVPTIRSRFLMRLELTQKDFFVTDHPVRVWHRHMRPQTSGELIHRPTPKAPLAAKPVMFSPTAIELLRRDPYSYYARYILGLRKLPEMNGGNEHQLFGVLVHDLIRDLTEEPRTFEMFWALSARKRQEFMALTLVPEFWEQRLKRILSWVCGQLDQVRESGTNVQAEVTGVWHITPSFERAYTLRATADRIDFGNEGIELLDYKTGQPPTMQDVKLGLSPQLPLEGLIALHGGFGGDTRLSDLAWWILMGNSEGGNIISYSQSLEELLAQTEKGLINLLINFETDEFPFIAAPFGEEGQRVKDYQHLMRMKAW